MDDGFEYSKPTQERLDKDYKALALGFLPITHCPSGRPTLKTHHNCAHCGVNLTDIANRGFCGQPLDEDGNPQDMTVARRIMRNSMRRHGEA
jgi:hypothetical protein